MTFDGVRTEEEQAKVWFFWKRAVRWLNETGKLTAKLDEEPVGDNDTILKITIERTVEERFPNPIETMYY